MIFISTVMVNVWAGIMDYYLNGPYEIANHFSRIQYANFSESTFPPTSVGYFTMLSVFWLYNMNIRMTDKIERL
jgi:hypothetical protein